MARWRRRERKSEVSEAVVVSFFFSLSFFSFPSSSSFPSDRDDFFSSLGFLSPGAPCPERGRKFPFLPPFITTSFPDLLSPSLPRRCCRPRILPDRLDETRGGARSTDVTIFFPSSSFSFLPVSSFSFFPYPLFPTEAVSVILASDVKDQIDSSNFPFHSSSPHFSHGLSVLLFLINAAAPVRAENEERVESVIAADFPFLFPPPSLPPPLSR